MSRSLAWLLAVDVLSQHSSANGMVEVLVSLKGLNRQITIDF